MIFRLNEALFEIKPVILLIFIFKKIGFYMATGPKSLPEDRPKISSQNMSSI